MIDSRPEIRFFPGTSVLHTRIRYALFVPWIYHRAAFQRVRGTDLRSRIDHLQIELAIRLKLAEPVDVIGGDALGRLTSQPPDLVYWNALRLWNLVLPGIETRKDALRRLQAARHLCEFQFRGAQGSIDAERSSRPGREELKLAKM